ncbi:MAG: ABC transporter ATP-binding protein [Candidatus Korobacteraceae bacterium]|jgi:branched-chain amino acid transport system ATP-binding protein
MLVVEDVVVEYGGMTALRKVSIKLAEGEFVSIVGPNGAGKSTILKAISGTVRCKSGHIYYRNNEITGMPAHKRTELGIIHVPEGRRIFPSLTVMENLEIGAYRPEARGSAAKTLEMVFEYFPILKERREQRGSNLSGGEQQMLAISRGLMSMPHVLILDEPSLGLSPRLTEVIFEAVRKLQENLKFSILLVEQRALEALELCNRGYILESGRITTSGDREQLMGNSVVQRAYLGAI